MATETFTVLASTGQTLYAYPASKALTSANWTAYATLMTEGSSNDAGRYTVSVDTANGKQWLAFSGATIPTNWTARVTDPVLPGEVSGVWVDSRTQTRVGEEFTRRVSRRRSGNLHASKPFYIGTDNSIQPAVALELEPVYGDVWVATVSDPTITPSGELAITASGGQGTLAVLQLGGGQVAGQTYKVEVAHTMQNGDADIATCYVEVISTPSTP